MALLYGRGWRLNVPFGCFRPGQSGSATTGTAANRAPPHGTCSSFPVPECSTDGTTITTQKCSSAAPQCTYSGSVQGTTCEACMPAYSGPESCPLGCICIGYCNRKGTAAAIQVKKTPS